MQVWDDWPRVVRGPGPKLGGSSTEKPAAVKLRPGGTSSRCEAGADKAPSSTVAERRSGMLWGSVKLAKLTDAEMCVRHECRVLCRFWVVIITQLLMPVGSQAASCFSP